MTEGLRGTFGVGVTVVSFIEPLGVGVTEPLGVDGALDPLGVDVFEVAFSSMGVEGGDLILSGVGVDS